MPTLPPPPVMEPPGSFTWLEWYKLLRNYISVNGSVPWSVINFAGSNLSDIATKLHSSLQGVQGGGASEAYHLTLTQHTDLVDGGESTLHYHAIDRRTENQVSSFVTVTATTYTVTSETNVICNTTAGVALTLPSATVTGRPIRVKTIAAGAVTSASSNVVPLAGGSAGTAILAATAGKWAEIVSNGTNWEIMEAN